MQSLLHTKTILEREFIEFLFENTYTHRFKMYFCVSSMYEAGMSIIKLTMKEQLSKHLETSSHLRPPNNSDSNRRLYKYINIMSTLNKKRFEENVTA